MGNWQTKSISITAEAVPPLIVEIMKEDGKLEMIVRGDLLIISENDLVSSQLIRRGGGTNAPHVLHRSD